MSDNGKEYTIQKGTYRIIDGELVQILDNELARECLMKELIAEGWTPPVEPEPEFKAGDLVQVVDREGEGEGWITTAFSHLNIDNPFPYVTHIGPYKTCRHAPTWIKWESGDYSIEDARTSMQRASGDVWVNHDGKTVIIMSDGRWAWMPE